MQHRRTKPFLVDNIQLGCEFRSQFIDGLRQLIQSGKLKLEGAWSDLLDADQREEWLDDVKSTAWNVFVEGPPGGRSDPRQVLKYLARYLTGGPIADSRLISHTNDQITFWARPKNTPAGQGKGSRKAPEPFTLKCIEFVRRWAMHILPKKFTKTRRYGGFSGSQCAKYLERCVQLLKLKPEELTPSPTVDSTTEKITPKCSRCECHLTLLSHTVRPSWRDVFKQIYRDTSIYSPMWHAGIVRHKSTARPPPSQTAAGV